MPSWPSNIPQYFNVAGFNEEPIDNAIRTTMETGDVKIRRRFTGQHYVISGAIDMTAAEFETFRAWWRDNLRDGVLSFDWVHPTSQQSATFWCLSSYRAPVFGTDNRRVALQFRVKLADAYEPATTPAIELVARAGSYIVGR